MSYSTGPPQSFTAPLPPGIWLPGSYVLPATTSSGILYTLELVVGAVGPQGAQGFQGTRGTQGFQGLMGFQGVQGFQGFQGNTGAQGTQGNTGAQGNCRIRSTP